MKHQVISGLLQRIPLQKFLDIVVAIFPKVVGRIGDRLVGLLFEVILEDDQVRETFRFEQRKQFIVEVSDDCHLN